MNLRKLLNFQTKEQGVLISSDIESILLKCDKIADFEYNEQKEAKVSHDETCPKCKAGKDYIVDKIRHVEGKGSVSGSFDFGFGSIKGSVGIDTSEINHCNKCGNEWKKFKIKYVSKSDIVWVALKYLAEILTDTEQKNYSWKIETIAVFDGCHAEAVYELYETNRNYLLLSLKLRELRRHYQSVFDKSPKNLKKVVND
jgi:predicted Zn-ribbon and HTH transcriptional regulator